MLLYQNQQRDKEMLRFLRKRATSLLVKGLFFMIIVVFVFWGIGTFRGREKVVAEIGKYRVYQSQYYEEQKRLVDFYRNLLKERFDEEALKDLKIKEKAIENVVDRYLLLLISEKLGIDVSEKEYAEHLESIEAFKKDGRFDKKRFLDVLKRSNIDPKEFEIRERIALRTNKSKEILGDLLVSIDENEIWEEYKRENGMVRLKYVVFSPEDLKSKVHISEKELEARYEKEKDFYVSEPIYRLKYILIDEKAGLKDDKAYMELIKSRDMESFAKSHGLYIYDSGPLSEREFKEKFKEIKDLSWLKDLRIGDISLPVREGSKSYIFQLTDYKKGEPLKKEVAIARIKEKLALEKARELARAKANEVLEGGNARFEKKTDFLSRNSTGIPNIGEIPEPDRTIFQLNEKNPIYRKPVEIGGKFYIFSFDSEKNPEKEVWEKRKNEYRIYFYLKKREEALKNLLRSMREKVKVKIYWEQL
jgi:parvulin-like peptidyl-prolyl isomerase